MELEKPANKNNGESFKAYNGKKIYEGKLTHKLTNVFLEIFTLAFISTNSGTDSL